MVIATKVPADRTGSGPAGIPGNGGSGRGLNQAGGPTMMFCG